MYNPGRWLRTKGAPHAGQHIGQVFRNGAQLAEDVSRYIADGLAQGDAVIVVATADRWASFVARLALLSSVDLADAVVSGQLRVVDADVALAALMATGMPDRDRFQDRAGTMITSGQKRFRAVRIYSDMSGLLWQKGNVRAALRLEQFCNELAASQPFTLLCGYLAEEKDASTYNATLGWIRSTHPENLSGGAWPDCNAGGADIGSETE
ncbi:MAG TPA: MEDS domain-containing protein [Noviherbaspirillum sp.]|uniref:MEDS domain-containing protein n=1 Tax=Noviherbaspirillum sp. TaxID=1926288 RepID=UPI002D3F3D08|nr:MEDS domain-containing protein [Noviherbaspirillum sp.]HYD97125.1 MEDS domain-containing protein [Noviherbaspirillum sp.]